AGHIPHEGDASRAVIDGPAADENIVVSRLAAGSGRLRERGRACQQDPLWCATDHHERCPLISRPCHGCGLARVRETAEAILIEQPRPHGGLGPWPALDFRLS